MPKTMKKNEVTHISQIQAEAFLRDVKGFNPLNDGECLITDFPVKAQSFAGYDAHAKVFSDGKDFSSWINQNTGVKTKAIGDTILWDEISDESKLRMNKYHFFHHEEDLHCPIQNRKVLKMAS